MNREKIFQAFLFVSIDQTHHKPAISWQYFVPPANSAGLPKDTELFCFPDCEQMSPLQNMPLYVSYAISRDFFCSVGSISRLL